MHSPDSRGVTIHLSSAQANPPNFTELKSSSSADVFQENATSKAKYQKKEEKKFVKNYGEKCKFIAHDKETKQKNEKKNWISFCSSFSTY